MTWQHAGVETRNGYSAALADTLRARDLVTPLHDVYRVQAGASAAAAAEALALRQFRAAPLYDGETVIGTITQEDLLICCEPRERFRPLFDGNVISADMALHDLFALMCRECFLLVLDGQEFIGVLTPSDLGRPPSRTYFYLLLAELEIGLAEVVRHHFPAQEAALALLSPGRRSAQQKLVEELRAQDDFLDDVAALAMIDLLEVVRKVPELARHYENPTWNMKKLLRGLGVFRNDVMHPVREFLTITSVDVGRLVDFDARLRHLVAATDACLMHLRPSGSDPH